VWLCNGCVLGDGVAVAGWQWDRWIFLDIASILIGDKSGFGLAVAGLHWQCGWMAVAVRLLIIHAR
jgi:hypothetical protein